MIPAASPAHVIHARPRHPRRWIHTLIYARVRHVPRAESRRSERGHANYHQETAGQASSARFERDCNLSRIWPRISTAQDAPTENPRSDIVARLRRLWQSLENLYPLQDVPDRQVTGTWPAS